MISEKAFQNLKPGDSVLIVDEWDLDGLCKENSFGEMDHWLGKKMTVKSAAYNDGDNPTVQMEEDSEEGIFGHGWYWNRFCIKKVVIATSDIVGLEELI